MNLIVRVRKTTGHATGTVRGGGDEGKGTSGPTSSPEERRGTLTVRVRKGDVPETGRLGGVGTDRTRGEPCTAPSENM